MKSSAYLLSIALLLTASCSHDQLAPNCFTKVDGKCVNPMPNGDDDDDDDDDDSGTATTDGETSGDSATSADTSETEDSSTTG